MGRTATLHEARCDSVLGGKALAVRGAEHMDYVYNRTFLEGAVYGRFDRDLDGVAEEDRPDVAGRMDYIGVNYYTRSVVSAGAPWSAKDLGLPVTDMDWFHPVCEAFMDGAGELGIPRCADYNSGDDQAGVGYFQRAINRGYRHSSRTVGQQP